MDSSDSEHLWFDFEEFASMAGFSAGQDLLREKGKLEWTNTAFSLETGGIHGLCYKVDQSVADRLTILLQHWVQWPGGKIPAEEQKKRNPHLLTFEAETRIGPDGRLQVRPTEVTWMRKTYKSAEDMGQLLQLLQETAAKIRENILHHIAAPHDPRVFPRAQRHARQTRQRDEIPNLYHIAELCRFKTPFAIEGMAFNGESSFTPVKSDGQPPVYPLQLLRPMLALENDIVVHGNKPFSRTYSMPGEKPASFEGVTYHYTPGEKGFELSCNVWRNGNFEKEETTLYKIAFEQEGTDPDGGLSYRLTHLDMLGKNPDITDHKGVARAIRAMKYIHMAIQRHEPPIFSEILHANDLKSFLGKPSAPETGPDNPRVLLQVYGANTDAVLSQKEKGIGSNGLAMIFDYTDPKTREWVKVGYGKDWGITFGDPKNEYYHSISHNFGRFLWHPAATHITPYFDNVLNLETHEHEDHLRGIVRFAKFGYTLPPMVMNRHTQRTLKDMMLEEKVDKEDIDHILSRCHIIDIRDFIDMKPEDKGKVETFEYGDTVIEQAVETIWSESEQREKYFPLLHVRSKKYPDVKFPSVRVGPAGHSALALMFETAGVLYTGDYKLDPTAPADMRTDLDWLARCNDTALVHIQETTNTTRPVPFNTPLAEYRAVREKHLYAERKKGRAFCDVIGSNAIDIMEGICRAAGNVRKRVEEENRTRRGRKEELPFKYVIFAGSAVRRKYSALNETHDLKKMMEREYGITLLHADSKEAQRLFERSNSESYMVIMTGTQDEPLSLTHRISRDLHDKIRLKQGDPVFRLQTPIPVGNNFQIRVEQNNRYRHDFGCVVYDTWEMAAKGEFMSSSSHASQDDYRAVHKVTPKLIKFLFHGGPKQLEAGKALYKELGADARVPEKQALYHVDVKNRTVNIIAESPEERVGIHEIRDDEREFYKKHRQKAMVVRVKDRWNGEVAAQMNHFEQMAARHEAERNSAGPTNRGANLAEVFNDRAQGMANFPPIGIMHPKLKRPYWDMHKAIKLFIGMDTETTGANPNVDVHTDASFVATTPDGEIVGKTTLKNAIPRYVMASAAALGVTHNTEPQKLHKRGMTLRRYVYELHNVYRKWPQKLTGDSKATALFYHYRGSVFDNPITMRMMGMAMAGKDMTPSSTQGNLSLDAYNLYTALIALTPDKVNVKRDAEGNCIRTLRSACLENGIDYDDEKAHGSLADAHSVRKLLFKFKDIAPDIFEQMVVNCDFSTSRRSPMIDHILGMNQHLNDQAPVFGYVDMRDRTCTPRLGGLITINGKAKDAIVVDLARTDIQQLDNLSDEKLLELMNDRKGPFAVIKLNKSPCLFPPEFVWREPKIRAKAAGRIPKTTILQRANALRQANADNHEIGNSLAQRVDRLYRKSALCRNPAYHGNAAIHSPVNDNVKASEFRLPNERIFSIFHVLKPVNQIDRHYKAAAAIIRDLQPKEEEFKPGFDQKGFWRKAIEDICALSKETGGRDPYIEDLRFMIEWQADDACPDLLPQAEKKTINALKSAMLHGPENSVTMTVARFRKEIETIENDPEQFARIVGEGPEAQEKWKEMKGIYLAYAASFDRRRDFKMTEAKRTSLREHRRNEPPRSKFN
jgi:mRNA degradation ribonuclease J1/J2